MKIAIRAGHNELATGCAALINEVVEARNLLPHIIKTLEDYDNEVLDVTPGRMDKDSDLAYGVRKANEWGADLFVSIHFNKAYNSYSGKIGTECWVYSKSDSITLDEQVAQRIVNKLAGVGFIGDNNQSRGVKVSNEFYELKQTKMASVILETCFVEATGDVELYKELGHKRIGALIAEGILNKTIETNNNQNSNINKEEEILMQEYIVQYSNDTDKAVAEHMADRLNCPTINCASRPFKYYSHFKTVISVGEGKNKSGYTNVEIKGSNRVETMDKAIAWLKGIGR